jgi:hypothetical protein
MIIHQPELLKRDDHTILTSKIELEHFPIAFPDFLWFRIPDQFSPFLSLQSDAFLIPCILAAMYLKEDIEVRGPVSPRLAYHLEEYQHLLHFGSPKEVTPINIDYLQLKPLETDSVAVGTTFSGGVDSLFTVWKHLPQNQSDQDFQITHGIFLKGFDILPAEDQHYQFLLAKYRLEAEKIGIKLIPLETNLVSIIHQRLSLIYFYGPIIAAAGIVLAGGFRKFLIPSSRDYENLRRNAHSSDPLLDRLLSTDTLDIIHHGSTHLRVEKVQEIADWKPAQRLLWVCETHKFDKDTWNCSRCEKCIRTMIPLYAMGKLRDFPTFRKPFKSNPAVLWWARKFSPQRVYSREIFPFVKKHNPALTPWLRIAAALGVVRYWVFIKFLPGFVKKWLRRYGYFTDRNEALDAYEIPEITQSIRDAYDHTST